MSVISMKQLLDMISAACVFSFSLCNNSFVFLKSFFKA